MFLYVSFYYIYVYQLLSPKPILGVIAHMKCLSPKVDGLTYKLLHTLFLIKVSGLIFDLV